MMDTPPLAADLPAVLVEETATLCSRFAAAAAAAGHRGAFDPALSRVFAASPFVAEVAIQRPVEFLAMIGEQAIEQARDRDTFDRLVGTALAADADQSDARRALRQLRQLEMARIAWRDLHLGRDVFEIMAELSAFADAVIAGGVTWIQEHLAARYGRAFGADGAPLELLVIGMGKLGGGELNFSSDIDLIFVYGGSGTTAGGRRELVHQDYFDRVGREFIGLLNETTADGFVFRVDMRLRPFGDSGPLTTSLSGLEHYYAAHGRDWERYALIKGRAITGDSATRQELEALVRPFVYRRYLDFGALDALREMKQLINREASSAQLRQDVKRGAGGIREIEFTGQLFQLIRGGREPSLRHRSLIATLEACRELGLLEDAEVDALIAAYRFLRTTEHRLQQVHDWQTHALPTDAAHQARLAYALGYPDWAHFLLDLNAERDAVRALFATLLQAPDSGADEDAPEGLASWRALWLHDGDADALAAAASQAGHPLGAAERDMLLDLKSERFLARLSRPGRERLDRLMPPLLQRIHEQRLPDVAVMRIADLLHAIARRSVYVAFLIDNPAALERLLQLFAASPWIAEQIIAQPLLLDELLDPRALFSPPDQTHLRELVAAQVRPDDGLEQAMESLRAFRNQQLLRVAASDVTGQFPVAEVSNQLTYIAEACVGAALELAWHELSTRFGEPTCDEGHGPRRVGFAVIGYGKLGGLELGYGSDLDLVFLNDGAGSSRQTEGPKVIENNVFFTRLVQRFIHILSTNTPTGVAYEVDTRLRPSGSAGMLVTSTSAFREYLNSDAWIWEHQALVRARDVAGDRGVREAYAAIRAEVLARPRDVDDLKREIVGMRQRMLAELDRGDATMFDLKQGAGGITDIEFMVQYAVLRWASSHPALLTWTDNLRLLETIAALKLLDDETCRRLHDAYFAYRADLHRCTLLQTEGLVEADRYRRQRDEVIAIWKQLFE